MQDKRVNKKYAPTKGSKEIQQKCKKGLQLHFLQHVMQNKVCNVMHGQHTFIVIAHKHTHAMHTLKLTAVKAVTNCDS